MLSKETSTIKEGLVEYIKYLDGLSNHLQMVERKFVMKQHIEGLVNEAIAESKLT